MFKRCEICGHRDDLVYYKSTNTFYCWGAHGGKGGTIIDYLMAVERLNLSDAIDKFKYELCGLPKKEKINFTLEQKRDYAINKQINSNDDLQSFLQSVQPHINYAYNDKGFGELFADVYKNHCRYNVTAKEWYVYNGKIWVEDIGAMKVSRLAKELMDGLLIYATTIQDEDKKTKFIEYVNKFGQLKYRKIMVEDSRDKYYITKNDFDKDLYIFNCQNGTLNLQTFEFKPHSPNDLVSKISNVTYDETATSPRFDQFINDVMMNNIEKITYLQKILGYALTGDTRLETCFILYGATTRNGKSTLMETFAYMLGNTNGYALNMKPETLAQKQNQDSRQSSGDIARLDGCRFLNVSEPPKRMIFDVPLVKALLGRDTITARHLYERDFEFVPVFKLFINTNTLPIITDDTLFSSNRLNVITFDKHFSPSEQDRTLKDTLKKRENISGLFNWCIEGLKKFYKEDAEPPRAIIESTDEYRKNSDKIGNFINECLIESAANSKAKDIYDAYQVWCKSNGYGAENKGNFFAELKAKNMLSVTGTVDGKTITNVVKGYILAEECKPFDSSYGELPLPKKNFYNAS